MIEEKGNPNGKKFADRVSALYSVAYAVKMRHKSMMSGNSGLDVIEDCAVRKNNFLRVKIS